MAPLYNISQYYKLVFLKIWLWHSKWFRLLLSKTNKTNFWNIVYAPPGSFEKILKMEISLNIIKLSIYNHVLKYGLTWKVSLGYNTLYYNVDLCWNFMILKVDFVFDMNFFHCLASKIYGNLKLILNNWKKN